MTDAPKTPSVTVSPSGEIEEGSSVTLSCSSDANPAANYTWFKEHEDSVRESGKHYTITNITSEHGGNYYWIIILTLQQIHWLHINQIVNSHVTFKNIELELKCPYLFSAWQRYVPLSSGRTEGKVWGWLGPQSRGWLFLNQVYSAAVLASLLQLRVTELPSSISPEELDDKNVCLGPSGDT